MYKKILCPVDGSPASNKGMKEAINLAISLNAALRFLHVIDTYFPIIGGEGDYVLADMTVPLRKHAQKIVKKAIDTADKSGVKAEAKLTETLGGRPSTFIVNEADKWPADLIVMGTRGMRGISRMVVGSDAEQVIRTARMPVMLINSANKKIKP